MNERKITRRVKYTVQQVRRGDYALPEGVTYLVTPNVGGGSSTVGEFPQAPMDGDDCPAALLVKIGTHEWEPWCTRSAADGHELHVAHVPPGVEARRLAVPISADAMGAAGAPIAAWRDDPAVVR